MSSDPQRNPTTEEEQNTINLPSSLPQPTGNLAYDSVQSALNVTSIPCSRESLLAGIAAGVGIGVVRGLTLPPIKAGNWAVATFALTSLISWQICQNKIKREREQVATVLEQAPRRRAVASGNEKDSSSSATTNS
ncbi:hypothetical protein AGABI1DRAFT_128398 [Agaricus bisporus var. burnettii JB137-S8]|uniref:Cytochrome c oxidase assembly protein COX20, mitochondrial n=1 Tax=Agaricus bisporus var. burnettii (strain JB137-S8 / ATCC MYA-4627 / FGSC 10392) TaxID=597362 RepID=K5VXM5_AGABU|nr:uncharacterized protein AGABI1DRAFT_128398 [Agaricus bisporus var. burnettii JB137-S8]EKM79239.1 hypothetical protein AGABI1DRAFT_128398 [Agaricus bisporus var. burnettii JB137-S8]